MAPAFNEKALNAQLDHMVLNLPRDSITYVVILE